VLKVRIIGVVLVKNGIAVQSIGFKRYLPIGKPEISIQYLNRWGIDEIVVLHIDDTQNKMPPTSEQVKSYAAHCQVPLSIGGGISTIENVKKIIRAGADKIILNTSIISDPELIQKSGDLFGQQCVVASIDARRTANQEWMTYTHGGKKETGMTASSLAQKMQSDGAGEILLTSIDQDGSKQGYDLNLIQSISDIVDIPVIACGGAGHPKHACEAIQAGACAVAVGNLFHFSEHSVILFKKYLKSFNQPVRLDSYVDYKHSDLDQHARILKQSDDVLNTLRFQYIPEEVI